MPFYYKAIDNRRKQNDLPAYNQYKFWLKPM